MSTAPRKRLTRAMASLLAASLILLSPGIGAYEALANVLRVPVGASSLGMGPGAAGVSGQVKSSVLNDTATAGLNLSSVGVLPTVSAPSSGVSPLSLPIEASVNSAKSVVSQAASRPSSRKQIAVVQKRLAGIGKESTGLTNAASKDRSHSDIKRASDFTLGVTRTRTGVVPVPVGKRILRSLGLNRFSQKESVSPHAIPTPEASYATTPRGQLLWALGAAVRTGLFVWLGVELMNGNLWGIDITGPWRAAAIPAFTLAALSGVRFVFSIPGRILSGLSRLPRWAARPWAKISTLDLGQKELFDTTWKYALTSVFLVGLILSGAILAMGLATLGGALLDIASGAGVSGVLTWLLGSLSAATGIAMPPVVGISVLIAASLVVYTAVNAATRFIKGIVSARVHDRYRRFLFDRFLRFGALFFGGYGGSKMADRVVKDSENLLTRHFEIPLGWLEFGFYALVASVGMFFVSAPLAGAVMVFVPVSLWLHRTIGKRLEALGERRRDKEIEVKVQSQTVFDRIPKMIFAGTKDFEVDRLEGPSEELVKLHNEAVRVNSYSFLLEKASEFFSTLLPYLVGTMMLGAAFGLSYGQIVTMVLYTGIFYQGVNGLFGNYIHDKEEKGKTKAVRELIDSAPSTPDAAAGRLPDPGPLSLRFEDVRFGYPDGTPVLNGVSFDIPAGKKVALMGPSGGGKSTLIELIPRLLEGGPTHGLIRIGGVDVSGLSPDAVRSRIAYVQQDAVLLDRSVRENMTMWAGRPVSDGEIGAALERAKAGFLLKRPGGLDAVIGASNGLSGGEAKRMMLAGAFLRDADLMILDEPTRGLDAGTRNAVMRAILDRDKGGRKRTTVMVTHDPGLAKKADLIVVLDGGVVIEQGTPKELQSAGGWFAARLKNKAAFGDTESGAAEPAEEEEDDSASADPTPKRTGLIHGIGGVFNEIWVFITGDKIVKPILKIYRRPLLKGILFSLIAALLVTANAHFLGTMLDTAFTHSGQGWVLLKRLLLWGGAIGVSYSFATYLSWRTWQLIGYPENAFYKDVRVFAYRKLLGKDYRFYLDNSPRQLAAWLEEGTDQLVEKNISIRIPLIENFIAIAVSVGFMVYTSAMLSAFLLPGLILIGIANLLLGNRAETVRAAMMERHTGLWGRTKEVFDAVRHFKLLNRREAEAQRFADDSGKLGRLTERKAKIEALGATLGAEITQILTYWGVLVAGSLAVTGLLGLNITLGGIIAMTLFAQIFDTAFAALAGNWLYYKETRGATARVLKWLEARNPEDEKDLAVLPPLDGGAIDVKNLHYRYAEGGPPVLKGVTFRIEAGETALLIGKSGSGKSTLLWNLLGLLKPTAGTITVGGHDLAKVKKSSYIDQIGVVDQKPDLFPGTLRFNLTYGLDREVDDEELLEVSRIVGADFVAERGLDVELGPKDLSGGEIQRVNIARALLRRPKILFLDEPASQLDPDLVDSFWDMIAELKDGHPLFGKPTVVIVTHNVARVSKMADVIIRISGGKARVKRNKSTPQAASAFGHFVSFVISAAATVLISLGVSQTVLAVLADASPLLLAAAVPAGLLGVILGTMAIGYLMIGFRIGAAMWKHSKKLRTSLFSAIATPDEEHAALGLIEDEETVELIKLHEQTHRDGHGEFVAYFVSGFQYVKNVAFLLRNLMFGPAEIWKHMKNYRGKFLKATFALVFDSFLILGISMQVAPLMDLAVSASTSGLAGAATELTIRTVALTGTVIVYALIERTHTYWSRWVALYFIKDFRKALAEKLLSLSMTFHGRKGNESGVLANHLKTTANYLAWMATIPISFWHYAVSLVLSVGAMFYYFPALAPVVLAILPVLALIGSYYGRKTGTLLWGVNEGEANLLDRTQVQFSQIGTIKGLGAEQTAVEAFQTETGRLRDMEVDAKRLTANFTWFGSFVDMIISYKLMLWAGWIFALGTGMTFGQLLLFGMLSFYLHYAVSGMSTNVMFYKQYYGGTEILRELMAETPDIVDAPDAEPIPEDAAAGVEFKDVSFAYPSPIKGEPPVQVLENVSLKVEAGQTAAFVGPSGSGKSTIVSLIGRLIERNGGEIIISGRPIEKITQESLRANFAVVPQDSDRMFNGTILDNITYGRPGVGQVEIDRAVRLSGVETFINDRRRFPEGINTLLADGGKDLSGGQRQLIALARAIILRSPYLVLDETTAALDYKSERLIEDAIARAVSSDSTWEPTVLKVAHRLATVKNADIIFYLDDGKIIEQGTYDELIALNGRFAAQVTADAAKSESNADENVSEGEVDEDADSAQASARGQFRAAGISGLLFAAALAGAVYVGLTAGWLLAVPAALLAIPFAAVSLAYLFTGIRVRTAVRNHLSEIEAIGARGPDKLFKAYEYLPASEREVVYREFQKHLASLLSKAGLADQDPKYAPILRWMRATSPALVSDRDLAFRLLREKESEILATALQRAVSSDRVSESWRHAVKTAADHAPRAGTFPVADESKIAHLIETVGDRVVKGEAESAYRGLSPAHRKAIDAHEFAHRDRGAGEFRAHLAQLKAVPSVLKEEVGKGWSLVMNLIRGDDEARAHLERYRGKYRVAMWLLVVSTLVTGAAGYLSGVFIDAANAMRTGEGAFEMFGFAFETSFAMPLLTGIIIALVLAIPFLARQIVWYTGYIQANLMKDLRDDLHERTVRREMSFFRQRAKVGEEHFTSGSVASRIVDDAKALASKNAEIRIPLLTYGLQFVVSLAILLWLNPLMAGIILGIIPVLGLINGYYGHKVAMVYEEFTRVRANLARLAEEIFDQIRIVKFFNTEEKESKRYGEEAEELAELGAKDAGYQATQHMLSSSLTDLFTKHGIYLLGAWLIAAGSGLTMGQVVSTVFIAGMMKMALTMFSTSWLQFSSMRGQTVVARRWMNEVPAIRDKKDARTLSDVEGRIELRHLSMTYETTEETEVPEPDAELRARFTEHFDRLFDLEILDRDGGVQQEFMTEGQWDRGELQESVRGIANRVIDALDIERVTPELLESVDRRIKELHEKTGLGTKKSNMIHLGLASIGLEDVNLVIEPGERVAFSGGIGSGKSTILRMIQRLWDAQDGAVLIDGNDVRDVTLESLSASFAVAQQETDLIDDTIEANVLYGNKPADKALIREALRIAGADDFVVETPEGNQKSLGSPAGKSGKNLSGGQRQRIGIARAVLRVLQGAKILILDEPTSKLDRMTEVRVMRAIKELTDREGVTTLAVAHRLETIVDFDRIVVMDKGRMVQVGPPHELIAAGKGPFHELWTAHRRGDLTE